jgi:hypothetical protein
MLMNVKFLANLLITSQYSSIWNKFKVFLCIQFVLKLLLKFCQDFFKQKRFILFKWWSKFASLWYLSPNWWIIIFLFNSWFKHVYLFVLLIKSTMTLERGLKNFYIQQIDMLFHVWPKKSTLIKRKEINEL